MFIHILARHFKNAILNIDHHMRMMNSEIFQFLSYKSNFVHYWL